MKKAQREEANRRIKQVEEARKQGAQTPEQVVDYLTSKPKDAEAATTHKTALVRAELDTSTQVLQERYNISSFEEAQKKFRELEDVRKTRTLTQQEENLRTYILQNFNIRRDQVIIYSSSIKIL